MMALMFSQVEGLLPEVPADLPLRSADTLLLPALPLLEEADFFEATGVRVGVPRRRTAGRMRAGRRVGEI